MDSDSGSDDIGPRLIRHMERKISFAESSNRGSVMKYLRNGRRLTDDIVQSKKQEQQLTDAMLLQKEAILNENRASHVFHRRSSSVYNTRSSTRASQRNSFMLHRPSFFYRNRNPEPNAIYIKTIASDHNLTDEQPSEVGSKDFEMPDEIALRRSSWKPPKLDPKSLEALCKKYFDECGKVVVEIDEGLEAYQKNPEKLGKILKKRVHEAFMADFWALHYHYPKETHPKPGNGITRPPPSAKNFRLSPSEALDLSRRTKALAKPKHVTNNRTRPNTSPDGNILQSGTLFDSNAQLEKPSRFQSAQTKRHDPSTAAEAVQSSSRFLSSLGQSVKLDKVRIGSAGERALESKVGRKAIAQLFDVRSSIELDSSVLPNSCAPKSASIHKSGIGGRNGVGSAGIVPKLNKKAVVGVYQQREAARLEAEEREKRKQIRISTSRKSIVAKDTGSAEDPGRASIASVSASVSAATGKTLELPQILADDSKSTEERVSKLPQEKDNSQDVSRINLFSLVPKLLRFNFDAVVHGLKKPFSTRSEEEAAVIRVCLKPLKAFHNIQSDILFDQLCQTFQFLEFPKGHTVFKQGDFGDAWYIILFGAVNICVATDSSMSRHVVVQVNNAGESFGEMALVNRGPRLATVVAKTDVILLKVDKSDFEKISTFTHQIQKRQIRHFMRRYVPLFQQVSDSGIRTVSEHVIMRSFADKTVIVDEEGCLNDVFIIKSGTCNVYRNLILEEESGRKIKHVLVGTLGKGCHFNDQIIEDPRNINGAPFRVVADGPVECATIIAVGDWVNLHLHHPPSPFATMKRNDLVKIVMQDEGQRKFQALQRRLLLEIAKEQTQNPNAVVDDIAHVASADFKVKWRY